MTQWFRGHLEGHYVGTTVGKPGVSQYGSAKRYKLRIYRAMVRDIEVLETAPEEREVPDDCFYQAQIEDTRMLGIHPRSCYEGPIYDVSVSGLNVTHTTKKGTKTYGRVEGLAYGRYLLPELENDDEQELVRGKLTASEEAVLKGSEKSLVSEEPTSGNTSPNDEDREIEPLHPPTPPKERKDREPSHVPIPLLIVVMAVVLGLAAGAEPALLWLGAFVPIMAVRLILTGLFAITNTQRVFGAVLIVVQVACLGLMLLDWLSDGCMSINVVAVSGIGITALIASVLPSSLPLLCAGGSLGLVLFLWYGDVAVRCKQEASGKPTIETPAVRPSVHGPALPRTNKDGSWPRRGPR